MHDSDDAVYEDHEVYDGHEVYGLPPAHPQNALGILGFVLAIVLPPIGLLVSVVAVFRSPRGFAVAGIVIGLITSLLLTICAGFFYVFGGLMLDVATEMNEIDRVIQRVEEYQLANDGRLPTDLDGLGLTESERTDVWGNVYRLDAGSEPGLFKIVSAGADGRFDTRDDVIIHPGMLPEDKNLVMMQFINAKLEQRYEGK